MSKAITERTDDRPAGGGGPFGGPEVAPSVMREDEPVVARWIGLFSAVLVLVGAALLIWSLKADIGGLRTILATAFVAIGLSGLLFHATCEKDQLLRRVYGLVGCLWLVAGVLLMLFHTVGMTWAENLFLPGATCVGLALLFLLAFIRNEPVVRPGAPAATASGAPAAFDAGDWRTIAVVGVGIVGALLALVGFVGGNIFSAFLLPNGALLALLGLGYLWAFVFCRGSSDDLGDLVALGTVFLGALVFLVALVRSYPIPWIWPALGGYVIPTGLVLMALGLFYCLLYVLLRVDVPLVVMTRRELSTFFYSPIAYLVLLGFAAVGWFSLLQFVFQALYFDPMRGENPPFEPIVRSFFFGLVPVIGIIFIIPVLTMRSLSEEKRSGTLEVLLTVPVSEWTVVLSKFLATLIFFMITWLPWVWFLLSLRILGGEAFDFRPLLSFLIVLACTGAAFVAMGLFLSSFTRNQIVSAVLTFAGMFGLFFTYIVENFILRQFDPNSPWNPVLHHTSFVELWLNSLDGRLQPQFLVFYLSKAVFWLFLTVRVLEARKWS